MNLSNHYWYFKSALTPKFCDDLIAYANEPKKVGLPTSLLSRVTAPSNL